VITTSVVCRELIGRSSELSFLLARVRPGAARGSAVVVVRGEAGVGKSRLVAEFVRAAAQERTQTVVAIAREYTNAPYSVILDALEALRMDSVLTDTDRAGGSELEDKARRFSSTAAQFSSLARATPRGLAVVIEDVQWADGATIELLRFLAQRLASEPVLFVVTYRTEDVEHDSARARALSALEREALDVVSVEPLAPADIERLLRTVLRDAARAVPAPVLAEIRDLSDGRPLFAEELLRGVLERSGHGATARTVVPTSIRATVRERFASLAQEERDIVLHAAVVGRRFSAGFVARLSGAAPAGVLRALRHARDLQLVVEETDPAGDAFAFRHALTREVIYAELLRAEAHELHARAAEALAREPQLDVAAIAEHTYRARDPEHALAWNERAGDAAADLFAHGDAARHYERAYEFASIPVQAGALAVKIAEACYATGDVERSTAWFSSAIERLTGTEEQGQVAGLAIRRARVLFEAGRYEQSIAETRQLSRQLGDQDGALRFEVETMLAGLLVPRGHAEEAIDHLRIAEGLLELADRSWVARFNQIYGYALGILGRADEARERFALAVEHARQNGDNDVLVRALNNHGNVELAAGTIGTARALYAQALDVAEHTKNLRVVAWLSQNAALAALLAGDLDAAGRHFARAGQIEHGVPLLHRWRSALALHMATLVGTGRDAERRAAASAFEEAIESADAPTVATLAGALALDALADGRDAEAQAVIHRALPAVERPEAPYWLLAAAGRAGSPQDRSRARAMLDWSASRAGALGARGTLAMLDAREALRRRKREEAVAAARAAAAAFRSAGWLLDEAEALEVAGQVAEAVAILRRAGADGEVRRLTETAPAARRRRGDATLTAREREIVGLLVAGKTARAIADQLVISERTVETHVAAAYRKLGVSNRHELAAALATVRPP
jgi:DNA-binding CsgD family transcriptional regulator/tetratricopeptide (TPR) repeat protein